MTFAEWISKARVHFPALTQENCRPTSPADDSYNCIAWAADDVDRWWWPDPLGQKYWPPAIPRTESIDAFEMAFALFGYSEKSSSTLEPGKQKIALFVGSHGRPTHAARQLPDGWWASKLGQQIDIEHELSAIEGPVYGTVAVVLARTDV
ncbi:MAG: hypothetical protein JNG88_17650 [Phycisphaerales bacterium]|nr:hypothetical protein [Phycisphaerales bacterium]